VHEISRFTPPTRIIVPRYGTSLRLMVERHCSYLGTTDVTAKALSVVLGGFKGTELAICGRINQTRWGLNPALLGLER
jgi:hypothetical protein